MAEGDTNTGGEGRPPKNPYGPGMLIIFGIVFFIIGGYVLYALYPGGEAAGWEKDEEYWKVQFNWAAAIVAFGAGICSFILAAVRSKKRMPEPAAPAAPPSEPAAAESEPPESDD